MISNAGATLAVMRKELLEHVRTKRLLIVGSAFLLAMILGIAVGVALVRSAQVFGVNTSTVDERVVLVLYVFFNVLPFLKATSMTSALGILLSADAVVGEWRDRTLFLLLSKPVSRSAVLAGKVLASAVTTVGLYTVVFLLGLVTVVTMIGTPTATTLGHILVGAGVVALGTLPFVAFGIFCSCVFRSTVASFVVAFLAWTIGFPILGGIGMIIAIFRHGVRGLETTDKATVFFQYFDPFRLMDAGAYKMIASLAGSQPPAFALDLGWVLAAMALHTALWLGLSFWVVNRRDYA